MARGKDIENRRQAGITALQEDQQVIEQVGRLAVQRRVVLAHSGDHDLGRFLTELLGALWRSGFEKLAGVGFVGGCRAPLADRCREGLEGGEVH